MSIFVEIIVPHLPESVSNATVATWHKKPGEQVDRGEIIVEIETDKVIMEVPTTTAGVLDTVLKDTGAIITTGQVLGRLRINENLTEEVIQSETGCTVPVGPSVRRLIMEQEEYIDPHSVQGSGVRGRVMREDVEKHIAELSSLKEDSDVQKSYYKRSEKRIPMTPIRKRIAERLLEAKNSTAMLTTFNEVNMQAVVDLRNRYGEYFKAQNGIRLGFMSLYIKSVLAALKKFPEINASIEGEDVVYHNYFDISIAVSTNRGVVTPVLKAVDRLSLSAIEKQIKALAIKSNDGTLKIEDLTGGTFTITNGGVFGSLMSTPIVNPPQSAILGMHSIKDRPMVVNGEVVVLPMMYLALSYDHRLIDGKEAVSFLVMVKDRIEDPIRLLLDI